MMDMNAVREFVKTSIPFVGDGVAISMGQVLATLPIYFPDPDIKLPHVVWSSLEPLQQLSFEIVPGDPTMYFQWQATSPHFDSKGMDLIEWAPSLIVSYLRRMNLVEGVLPVTAKHKLCLASELGVQDDS